MKLSHPFLALIIPFIFIACGEEAPEITAAERCEVDDIHSFVVGEIKLDGDSLPLEVNGGQDTPGFVNSNEIRLNIGSAKPPNSDEKQDLIFRIFDAGGVRHLMNRVSEKTDIEPFTLQIVDATEIQPGSRGLTSLEDYDCFLNEGTICAQIGFDSTESGGLRDEDKFVYNAKSGTLTFEDIDNISRKVEITFELELGPHILGFQDDSSGHLEGCLAPKYKLGNEISWPLL